MREEESSLSWRWNEQDRNSTWTVRCQGPFSWIQGSVIRTGGRKLKGQDFIKGRAGREPTTEVEKTKDSHTLPCRNGVFEPTLLPQLAAPLVARINTFSAWVQGSKSYVNSRASLIPRAGFLSQQFARKPQPVARRNLGNRD